MTLEKQELLSIYGGGISWPVACAIVAGAVFIIGTIWGYVNPLPCNK